MALKDGKTLVMATLRLRIGYSDQEYNTLKDSESLTAHNPMVTTGHESNSRKTYQATNGMSQSI